MLGRGKTGTSHSAIFKPLSIFSIFKPIISFLWSYKLSTIFGGHVCEFSFMLWLLLLANFLSINFFPSFLPSCFPSFVCPSKYNLPCLSVLWFLQLVPGLPGQTLILFYSVIDPIPSPELNSGCETVPSFSISPNISICSSLQS